MLRIPRKRYADLFGPTVDDRVRLADTDLIIEIEKDLLSQERARLEKQWIERLKKKTFIQMFP